MNVENSYIRNPKKWPRRSDYPANEILENHQSEDFFFCNPFGHFTTLTTFSRIICGIRKKKKRWATISLRHQGES